MARKQIAHHDDDDDALLLALQNMEPCGNCGADGAKIPCMSGCGEVFYCSRVSSSLLLYNKIQHECSVCIELGKNRSVTCTMHLHIVYDVEIFDARNLMIRNVSSQTKCD
jgi:hypothetical protein